MDTRPHVIYSISTIASLLQWAVKRPQPTPGSYHPASRPAYATFLLENLSDLWHLLLELPYVLQSEPLSSQANEDGRAERLTVRWSALDLAMAELKMRELMSGSLPPDFLESLAPQVVVRCWLLATSPKMILETEHSLSIIYDCGSGDIEKIVSFVDKAIALKTISPRQFVKRCNSRLRLQDVLDHELVYLMNDLGFFCCHEKMQLARVQDRDHIVLLLHAAQRQLCHGRQDDETHILEMTFSHILRIMPDDMARFRYMHDFFRSLAMLLGRATVLAALEPSDSPVGKRGMKHIREMLAFFAVNCITQGPANPADYGPGCSDFVGSVQHVWRTAYDKLRSLPADAAPHKSEALALWTDFGRHCEIDTSAPAPPLPSTAGRDGWSKDMGCAWRECLCFGEKPQHKLRKCNGCGKIMYCSKKCQRRDWTEGGHKSVCRSSSQ
ncbi:zinc finger MYND domain-containing protein [Phanerochaete sordida]|uniref:Zinc finger MYND domain-containing protein n=1 Tax=Phanerochaete sordida TaxID=48140 RepID=A0A9P3GBM7_9APHY|nr:zinc finger MYND domain-containing protein [Phanerochaete sordida]